MIMTWGHTRGRSGLGIAFAHLRAARVRHELLLPALEQIGQLLNGCGVDVAHEYVAKAALRPCLQIER